MTEVALVDTERLVIGVDLGHRHVRAAIANSSGDLLAEVSEQRSAAWQLDRDIALLTDLRARVVAEAGAQPATIAQIALGVPVPLQAASRRLGPLARGWSDRDVRGELTEALGAPVVLDNDANLGALGEGRRGAGRGCADFIYVKLAHGVGAGLVLDSRVYHGGLGAAGEIGHMSINDSGPLCTCGGRGCLELYAGGRAIAATLAEVHGSRPTLAEITQRCSEGEPSYLRAVGDAGRHLGVVLGNVANLLAPQRIVLGGELSNAGDTLIEAVRLAVRPGASTTLVERVEVTRGDLGERAELLGAVELALSALRAQLGIPTGGGIAVPL